MSDKRRAANWALSHILTGVHVTCSIFMGALLVVFWYEKPVRVALMVALLVIYAALSIYIVHTLRTGSWKEEPDDE